MRKKLLHTFLSPLTLCAVATAQLPEAATPSALFADIGQGIGIDGFVTSEAGGSVEIIATGWKTFLFPVTSENWAIYRHDPDTGRVNQVFTVEPQPDLKRYLSLDVGELDPRPGPEIAVLASTQFGTQIEIWNQIDRELLRTIKGEGARFQVLCADLNGDGIDELLLQRPIRRPVPVGPLGQFLVAVDVQTEQVLWEAREWVDVPFHVGELDGDPTPEILAFDGRVIDGATGHQEEGLGLPRAVSQELVDLDGDGIDEVVCEIDLGFQMHTIEAWSFVGRQRLWQIDLPLGNAPELRSASVGDFDQDGVLELAMGRRDSRFPIQVVEAATGVLEYEPFVRRVSTGAEALLSADIDGDGVVEILFTTGHRTTGPDHLHVWSVPGGEEFRSAHLVGPYAAVQTVDLDGDGQLELLTGAANSNDGGGGGARLMVFDEATDALLHVSDSFESALGPSTGNVLNWSPQVRDLDGDGDLEISLSTGRMVLFEYDRTTGFQQVPMPFPVPVSSLARHEFLDLDGDGDLELVVFATTIVAAFDYPSGQELWRQVGFRTPRGLEVLDLDGDGSREIVTVDDFGQVAVLDGQGQSAWFGPAPTGPQVTSLDTVPASMIGVDLLLAGDQSGGLSLLQLPSGSSVLERLGPLPLFTQPIQYIQVLDPEVFALTVGEELLIVSAGQVALRTRPLFRFLGRDLSYQARTNSLLVTGDRGIFRYDL